MVFYWQAWYHSGACVTTSTIFSSIFAPVCIIFLSTVKSGPLIYKGSTAKKSKKLNTLTFHLLFASIERGDLALSNDTKSKLNDAIFDFLEFFVYLCLRPYMGSGGPNL